VTSDQGLEAYPLARIYGWRRPAVRTAPLYLYPPRRTRAQPLARSRLDALVPGSLHPLAAQAAQARHDDAWS
jgi:hypothetical protein